MEDLNQQSGEGKPALYIKKGYSREAYKPTSKPYVILKIFHERKPLSKFNRKYLSQPTLLELYDYV